MLEFRSAAELVAHYAAVRRRMRALKPPAEKTAPKPPIVLAAKPAPPPLKLPVPVPPETRAAIDAIRPVHRIVRIVAAYYGAEMTDICSRRRTAPVAWARHVACYLARRCIPLASPTLFHRYPLNGVARVIGCDHSTVIYGDQRVAQALRAGDPDVTRQIKQLLDLIRGGRRNGKTQAD